MFVLIAGSQLFGTFLNDYSFGVITERVATRVREKTFEKMLTLECSWFDHPDNNPGILSQKLATECNQVKSLTGETVSTKAKMFITVVVSLIISFVKSWHMTLIMMGLIPLITLGYAIQEKLVSGNTEETMQATNEAGAIVSQSLMNIRTVTAFGLEDYSLLAFGSYLIVPLQQYTKKGVITGVALGFSKFITLGGTGLAFYAGTQLVLLGVSTFNNIFLVILIIILGSVGLGKFAAENSDKVEAGAAAANIQKILLRESKISGMSKDGLVPDQILGRLELVATDFCYPMRQEHNVYSGLNLVIEAGQTVAMVGPSGCGKSTAVQLLERFYDPTGGAVLLDGVDLKTLKVDWLRQQIGACLTLSLTVIRPHS
jgi:ATP-binding cassette subfamily B (MDR/TAP) protein 1